MKAEPKAFDMDAVKPFYEGVDSSKLANVKLRLAEGRASSTIQRNRSTAKLLVRAQKASELLKRLPGRDESLHCILNGEFALFDFVHAALELGKTPISQLTIATLGFSRANVEVLGKLIDAGQVKGLSVLCSHYFSAQDKPIYEQMVELCGKHSFRLAAMRTHAKLLLMAIGKRRIVVESSANLRSCHNVEQATMYDSPMLYEFHLNWIDELLDEGAKS